MTEAIVKTHTKVCEGSPKREPRPKGSVGVSIAESNRADAKMDFYGTYIYLNEQVTLQNQDPKLTLDLAA